MINIATTVTISKVNARRSQSCVYFFHEGEDIEHNLTWRRWRPIQLYFDLLPAILRQAGMSVTDQEASQPLTLGKWNQYAGCKCGCSPGLELTRSGQYDLHVAIACQIEVSNAGDTSANT